MEKQINKVMHKLTLTFIGLFFTVNTFAMDFVVSTTNATGVGSLSYAIFEANQASGPHTITVDVAGTIDLTGTNFDYIEQEIHISTTKRTEIKASSGNGFTFISGSEGSSITGFSITGSTTNGIEIDGVTGITIEDNYIGISADGVTKGGNTFNGISIINTGSAIITNNVISANTKSGILIEKGASNSTIIKGNKIGTFASGEGEDGWVIYNNGYISSASDNQGNSENGIAILGTNGVIIGGLGTNDGNLISGNAYDGIYISTDEINEDIVSENIHIEGNYIGTSLDGQAWLSNGKNGIFIEKGGKNTIIDNLISGNNAQGIMAKGTDGDTISNNIIGLIADGTKTLPNPDGDPWRWNYGNQELFQGNGGAGIRPDRCTNMTIDNNVISGNTYWAIGINNNSSGIKIENNIIGLDATGKTGVGNIWDGIQVEKSINISISENTIGWNGYYGVYFVEVSSSIIENNLIGVNNSGDDLGNDMSGILIRESVGGIEISNNTIANNNHDGISLNNADSVNILGNEIYNNTTAGIIAFSGSQKIEIKNNIIRENSGDQNDVGRQDWASYNGQWNGQGIIIDGADKVTIQQNAISCNNGQGIDLMNGNGNIKPPVSDDNSTSTLIFGTTVKEGSEVDIYELDSCYSSNENLQGAKYIATVAVVDGKWSFEPSNHRANYVATVTDTLGNTSEFSFVSVNIEIPIVVFIDENEDGLMNINEEIIRNQKFKIIESFGSFKINELNNIFIDNSEKSYSLELIKSDLWKFTTDNVLSYDLANYSTNDTLFFGLKAISDAIDVATNITGSRTRAGFNASYWIDYMNFGTSSQDATLELTIDENTTFVESTPAPDSQDGNKLTWNYSSLDIFEKGKIVLTLKMPGVDMLGDTLVNYCKITTSGEDIYEANNVDILRQVLTGSYDPNDKLVDKGIGEEKYTLFKEDLEYTIRFQNTGTDTAFNVHLIDTIHSYLDIESFELVSSSHDVYYDISNYKKIVTFYFDNIMLPDSNVNEPASNGYVRFRISPVSYLYSQTEVTNTAYIYFDFNPAIVTNTVTNTYVSAYPGLTDIDDSFENSENVEVYPNPFKDELKVKSDNIIQSICLLDLTGKCVIKKDNIGKKELRINTSNIQQGVYFISLTDVNGKVCNYKLMKL